MHESRYPLLSKLAVEFLAIPATYAPSERIRSQADRVLSNKRNCLDSYVTSRIMFICENAHVLHRHYKEFTGESPTKDYLLPIDEDNEK